MTKEFDDWVDLATAAWLAPCLATVAMLETVRLAVAPTSSIPDTKSAPFEIPCPDEELFA